MRPVLTDALFLQLGRTVLCGHIRDLRALDCSDLAQGLGSEPVRRIASRMLVDLGLCARLSPRDAVQVASAYLLGVMDERGLVPA